MKGHPVFPVLLRTRRTWCTALFEQPLSKARTHISAVANGNLTTPPSPPYPVGSCITMLWCPKADKPSLSLGKIVKHAYDDCTDCQTLELTRQN